jgi:large subunit ribosomal protein L25
MKFFQLEGSPRADLGKKATKAVRKEEGIPCVLYGSAPFTLPYNGELEPGQSVVTLQNNKGMVVTHFTVTKDSIRHLIYTPEVYLVDLTISESVKVKAMIKDLQTQPVTDEIIHMDFLEIYDDKPITVEIPVALSGHSEGVKAGGKLSLEMRRLKVKGLYRNIPEKLDIDITNLALGKTIQVGSLQFENLELMNAANAVVCAVKLTRAARGAAAAK